MKTLLANPALLHIEKIVAQVETITIVIKTAGRHASCPQCGQPSTQVHSRYQRSVADLPWEGIAVRLELHTRKFFCRNEACRRRIFCERLPEVVAPYGRKTLRLDDTLTIIGFALGGRPGARAGIRLTLQASARTLLRRVRAEALSQVEGVRVLGVDDFAFRKGQRYGTILVDLEQHRVVDLLPDREAASLTRWLKAHPGVEFISRDRAPAYAEGASKGAPQAVQVADRFHLLKNLVEAFERVVRQQSATLREVARKISPRCLSEQMMRAEGLLTEPPAESDRRHPHALERQRQNRDIRRERYEAVKQMQQEGLSISATARRLGMHRETVRGFRRAETYPERAPAYRRRGEITKYLEYLRKRWSEGCFNALQLYREIKAMGFSGSKVTVRRHLHAWRAKLLPAGLQRLQALPDFSPPAPRQAVWWLMKAKELEPQQQEYVSELLAHSPAINAGLKLVKDFQALLGGKKEQEFDHWREAVKQSELKELQSFSDGLLKDEAAVRAAMTYEWSNGQVEGSVNRLKMIKREMFGRAGFDLLRSRVLHAP